jgi:integrase
MAAQKPSELIDKRIDGLRKLAGWGRWPDSRVRGLYLYLGPRRSVWRFLAQQRFNGKRSSTFRTLGLWPAMDVQGARRAALIVAGAVAAGTAAPGREVMRFGVAFEAYLDYLKTKAEKNGKPPRWWRNARKYADRYLLPEWGNWSLYDMSQNPRAVKTWHAKIAERSPTTADHCARLIRACYREEARLDRSLPPALPTSGIRFRKIAVSERVLDFPDFEAWRSAWDQIGSPIHRGYHLTALLTGCRPGELARIEQRDVDCIAMMLTIRNSKSGKDIMLPITEQIMYAINLSLVQGDFVFPGCSQIGHRSGLPVSGNALRHTFRSVAVSLGVSEMLIHFLMGHALEGVSARYTNELMVTRSAELRLAQERISARMFELLGLTG